MKIARAVLLAAISLAFLLPTPVQGISQPQDQEPANGFTEGAAAKLLGQIAEGLQGHSSKKMLNAFDFARMDDAASFKEQITAFFNQYETFRVHFKLVEVKDGTAVVDAELDATPRDAIAAPVHKRLQLTFTAANGAGGWKFVDVQPRTFFS